MPLDHRVQEAGQLRAQSAAAKQGESWMERYRFIVLDGNKVNLLNRDFVAIDDEVAIQLADGWRDERGGQVWRGDQLVKHWPNCPNMASR